MKISSGLLSLAVLVLPLRAVPVDLLLLHANIYTGDIAQPKAEAIAVRDGRIVFAGSAAQVMERLPERSAGLVVTQLRPE